MYYFESLIREALRRREAALAISEVAREVGLLYEDARTGEEVDEALRDPFFPLLLCTRNTIWNLPAGTCPASPGLDTIWPFSAECS